MKLAGIKDKFGLIEAKNAARDQTRRPQPACRKR